LEWSLCEERKRLCFPLVSGAMNSVTGVLAALQCIPHMSGVRGERALRSFKSILSLSLSLSLLCFLYTDL
jgi:hypothetical protein